MTLCFHCGDECATRRIKHQDTYFCCHGCKTVFDILNENNLAYYYELETSPGSIPSKFDGKFDFLKNETIAQTLLEFDELSTKVVSFVIPTIHCSSCIWVLENLNKLNPAILFVTLIPKGVSQRKTQNTQRQCGCAHAH